jgi:hypothetical protein
LLATWECGEKWNGGDPLSHHASCIGVKKVKKKKTACPHGHEACFFPLGSSTQSVVCRSSSLLFLSWRLTFVSFQTKNARYYVVMMWIESLEILRWVAFKRSSAVSSFSAGIFYLVDRYSRVNQCSNDPIIMYN